MDALLQLQNDLAAKVNSEPYFQYVFCSTVRDLVISQQIQKRLVHLTAKNGKWGCGILINMPTVQNVYANIDPPVSEFEITADIIENPEINFFLATGTLLTCEEVGRQVRMIFNMFAIGISNGGSLFAPDSSPVMMPITDIASVYPGCAGYRVISKLQVKETQQTRVSMPTLSNSSYTITLTNNTGGATIYYTVDGSFPGPGNVAGTNGASTATIYATPFVVTAGVTIRFAAYLAGSLGSNVGNYIAS